MCSPVILTSHLRKLTREYLSNVCYTVAGQEFRQWIDEKIEERNNKIKNDGDLIIEMDEEMYQSFVACNKVSSKCPLTPYDSPFPLV